MDLYRQVADFEESLKDWAASYYEDELSLFTEQMNLILEGQHRSFSTVSIGEERNAFLMLVSRLFNDFESAKFLSLRGFPDQAMMSIRDAVETALLIELFIVDNKRATRWMTHMKEYRASLAVAALRDEHGIETPLIDLYYFFSPLAHPNFLGAINVVSEVNVGDDQIMRLYHFGGVRNEGVIRHRLGTILVVQMIALHTLWKAFAELDPEFNDWWPRVRAMPTRLREAKVHVGIEEEEGETSDAAKQVDLRLHLEEFKAKYGRDEGGD